MSLTHSPSSAHLIIVSLFLSLSSYLLNSAFTSHHFPLHLLLLFSLLYQVFDFLPHWYLLVYYTVSEFCGVFSFLHFLCDLAIWVLLFRFISIFFLLLPTVFKLCILCFTVKKSVKDSIFLCVMRLEIGEEREMPVCSLFFFHFLAAPRS